MASPLPLTGCFADEYSWFGDHMLMPPGKFFTMFHFLVRLPPIPSRTI
jgi:hypothetical protein